MIKKFVLLTVLSGVALTAISFWGIGEAAPNNSLKVVIIQHGEKLEDGDNLSCQGGEPRLAAILYQKFNKPDYTYVPLGLDKSIKHARMSQTVAPFAIKYNLAVNSQFGEKDYATIAKKVLEKTGTVLINWDHSEIPTLSEELGVKNPPV